MQGDFNSLGNSAPNKVLSGLVQLARQKSNASRQVLAATLGQLFSTQVSGLTSVERGLMFDIMRTMVKECETGVRKTLATYLADVPDAPAGLINALANDEIEVAYPVLIECGALKDLDLIEVVRNCTFQHQMAVAVRDNLAESVSEALVESGDDRVLEVLLGNEAAKISPKVMEILVERSKQQIFLQEPVLRRCKITPELAKRMFMWVSVALRCYVIERFDIGESDLDGLLERAALEELKKTRDMMTKNQGDLNQISEHPDMEGAPIAEMMIQALQMGDVPLFIFLFVKESGLRRNLVMRLLIEPGGEGLAMVCRGLGYSRTFFSTLFTLSQRAAAVALGGEAHHKVLRQALAFFDETKETECRRLVQRWHLDSGYLNALRHIEATAQVSQR